jgi:CelD/BcsL family acetyltransferase involved in cellulose biosynthesis
VLTLELVDDDSRFASMAAEWDELLRGSAARTLFLTWEWLYTWWRHLGQGYRLAILAIRENGTLLGIAPFVRRRRWARLSALPTLEFLGTGEVGSDYLDIIARPDSEDRVLDAVADYVAARRVALHFRRFEPSVSLAARLLEKLHVSGWTLAPSPSEICPCIALEGHSWESYLASVGSKRRCNVRRRRRYLEIHGGRFERVSSPEQLREALPALFRLHLQRWQERGGSQAFHRAGLLSFHEELTQRALARGWLRMFACRLDGELVAVQYGFMYGGRFSDYQAGFDSRAAQLSVGTLGTVLSIQCAIEEGATVFDMLHGDEPYKFLWCREARTVARLEAFPPTTAGYLAQQGTTVVGAMRRRARLLRERAIGAAAAR